MSQRAMSIDNISFLSPPISKPLQYDYDKESDETLDSKDMDRIDYNDNNDGNTGYDECGAIRYNDDDNEEENNNIIPWKKLLRKTNSRLNLIT